MDPRFQKIAKTIVHHSLKVKAGEKVYILAIDDGVALVNAIVEEVYATGAIPFVGLEKTEIRRALLEHATAEQLEAMGKADGDFLSTMDCFVKINAQTNSSEFSGLSQDQLNLYTKHYNSHINAARKNLRWNATTYPNLSMAQSAGMSLEEFSDYYFDLMTLDYDKLEKACLPMALRMRKASTCRIIAPETDLTVSLKDFTALIATGEHNLPDGEIASTPARFSANGTIKFNIPSLHNGFMFNDIKLTFKDGEVVEATANDTERFLKEISLDEGCHYIGEFSMGTNPYVTKPTGQTLFDEKMCCSMHLALGACYSFPGRDNGNRSSLHWDLIQSHLPKYGGGEVWLDDELVRKDGMYVPEDLKCLNPDVYMASED